jgi:hypothetical protein
VWHNDGLPDSVPYFFLTFFTAAIERRSEGRQGICPDGWLSSERLNRRHQQDDRKLQALWTSHHDSLEVNSQVKIAPTVNCNARPYGIFFLHHHVWRSKRFILLLIR